MRKRLNWKIISSDLIEAREQLEEIEARVKSGKKPSAGEFEIMLRHAYHHLNFAWNVRHQTNRRYRDLSQADFKRWSKVPKVMQTNEV